MNVPQNDGLRLPVGVGADVGRSIRNRPQLHVVLKDQLSSQLGGLERDL